MGWDVRLPKQASYFFALLPDPAAAALADEKARVLCNWFELSARPRGVGKYHVTLWSWPGSGEPDSQELALLRRGGRSVRLAAFRLTFNEVATFAQGAERPALVVTGDDGVVGAYRLHDSLDEEMRMGGCRARRALRRPHLTLLYDRFRTKAFRVRPLSWHVTDFALIRSVPKRPYEILDRWPLQSG